MVKGFEKDILRAINNIINNAAQATVEEGSGIITIAMSKRVNFTEVSIHDNGKGIAANLKAKIFQPYFTTKSSGTGLGLAIVKNIINYIFWRSFPKQNIKRVYTATQLKRNQL